MGNSKKGSEPLGGPKVVSVMYKEAEEKEEQEEEKEREGRSKGRQAGTVDKMASE